MCFNVVVVLSTACKLRLDVYTCPLEHFNKENTKMWSEIFLEDERVEF